MGTLVAINIILGSAIVGGLSLLMRNATRWGASA
jgi:hypothetical protein